MAELTGRVALVTGASRNIGRAIARSLAASGAAIIVNARSSRAEAEAVAGEIVAAGGQAMVQLADVTDEGAVARMVAEGAARFGGIDILVNNAAIRLEAGIDELDLAQWRAAIAVILDSAFICVKACLPYLRASTAGAVVNIGGMTGQTGAKKRLHVVTAKSAITGFTRALAHELAADQITVNCVAPGLIDTIRGGGTSTANPDHYANRTFLLGRKVPPDEVAGMVCHLSGPLARTITGQVFHVNGGGYLGG